MLRNIMRDQIRSITRPYNGIQNYTLDATNGFQLPLTADSGTKWVLDKDGVLVQSPADTPAMPGCRFADGVWYPTDTDGTPIVPVEKLVRTPYGTVARYGPDYRGPRCEPAATNYLLNSGTPATQTTGSLAVGTYTLWVEGAGSAAVTAGTATISGNGTATEGTPDTFTVSGAGTVTVTVTDPLTYFQLEAGSFPTSRIPTTTKTVTRPADIITRPTPGWLMARKNDFWVHMRVRPHVALVSRYMLGCWYNNANQFGIFASPQNEFQVVKEREDTSVTGAPVVTVDADTLHDVIAYQSKYGIGMAVRKYDGEAWGEWSSWGVSTTDTAKMDILIPASQVFHIGSRQGTSNFSPADFPWTQLGRIPSNLTTPEAIQAWLMAEVETPPGGTYLVTADGQYLITGDGSYLTV